MTFLKVYSQNETREVVYRVYYNKDGKKRRQTGDEYSTHVGHTEQEEQGEEEEDNRCQHDVTLDMTMNETF